MKIWEIGPVIDFAVSSGIRRRQRAASFMALLKIGSEELNWRKKGLPRTYLEKGDRQFPIRDGH
jgi:hypothetical protein